MEVVFHWDKSKKLRQQELIETGQAPSCSEKFGVELADLDVETRRVLVETIGTGPQYVPGAWDAQPTLEQAIQAITEKRELERQAERERAEYGRRIRAVIDAIYECKTLDELHALHITLDDKGVQGARELAEQRLEREARKAEKAAWIEAHGSAHLKAAFGRGYDCQRLYVQERAAMEAPRFEVDFDGTANWKSRSCPSSGALQAEVEAERLGIGDVKTVWLIHPPTDCSRSEVEQEADWWDFEPCEAVVITGYLGKYTLIRLV